MNEANDTDVLLAMTHFSAVARGVALKMFYGHEAGHAIADDMRIVADAWNDAGILSRRLAAISNAATPTMSRRLVKITLDNLIDAAVLSPTDGMTLDQFVAAKREACQKFKARILAAFDAQSSALTASEARVKVLEAAISAMLKCDCSYFQGDKNATSEIRELARSALAVTPQPQTKQEVNHL